VPGSSTGRARFVHTVQRSPELKELPLRAMPYPRIQATAETVTKAVHV
jgi:hypothetical protein